jgi:hypothetical protein
MKDRLLSCSCSCCPKADFGEINMITIIDNNNISNDTPPLGTLTLLHNIGRAILQLLCIVLFDYTL